eukprot:Pgem_evm1s5814
MKEYYGDNKDRLFQIEQKYDPQNFFTTPQTIKETGCAKEWEDPFAEHHGKCCSGLTFDLADWDNNGHWYYRCTTNPCSNGHLDKCGGNGWEGVKCCPSGMLCMPQNGDYHDCQWYEDTGYGP